MGTHVKWSKKRLATAFKPDRVCNREDVQLSREFANERKTALKTFAPAPLLQLDG
jgi:hypothetical protein